MSAAAFCLLARNLPDLLGMQEDRSNRKEARLWLVTALAQLPGVDRATAGERFGALLPRPGERRPDATREATCVQLLKVEPEGLRRALPVPFYLLSIQAYLR